ncbi:hypothetical protein [Streptomyces sp. CC224B]|uniref:hypothetical protein n=1 Tax=Streptomyces sp. CC224B TaxID=3044571 RepID=UPI0024A98FD3|nr:hypothetical protein [Streptomyces sp. CC224B]
MPGPEFVIDTFQTAGALEAPTAPAWAAVARRADGRLVRRHGSTVRSGGHPTEQAARAAVARQLDAAVAA